MFKIFHRSVLMSSSESGAGSTPQAKRRKLGDVSIGRDAREVGAAPTAPCTDPYSAVLLAFGLPTYAYIRTRHSRRSRPCGLKLSLIQPAVVVSSTLHQICGEASDGSDGSRDFLI